jgi:sugar lactone lactonase YvrE
MSDQLPELKVDCRNELGEMPLWCQANATLYWIDVTRPGRIFFWRPATDSVDFWDFPDLVTGLNLTSDGKLLVHSRREILIFSSHTRDAQQVFSLPSEPESMRLNDGHCDRAGRLWVGSMPDNLLERPLSATATQATGQIWAIDGANARSYDTGFGCPNAICWSPDGATFYVADSCDGWIYAYDFDCDTGTLSDRREFFRQRSLGIPDGAAVDSEGYIWNARWGAGVVIRISPSGQLDRVVAMPTLNPTACCFGDHDLQTLYCTSARYGLDPQTLRGDHDAGGLFALRVGVPGMPLPTFQFSGAPRTRP